MAQIPEGTHPRLPAGIRTFDPIMEDVDFDLINQLEASRINHELKERTRLRVLLYQDIVQALPETWNVLTITEEPCRPLPAFSEES